MLKNIFTILVIFLLNTRQVSADVPVVSSSANLKYPNNNLTYNNDQRVMRLKYYFDSKGSPLASEAKHFVYWADKYGLDYRLLPAITGVESSFGNRIPIGSFNAYGWNNGNYRFHSWEDSIEHISKTLRNKYYDKGATNINKVASRYAPPSNSWSWKVKYFMDNIDKTPVEFEF